MPWMEGRREGGKEGRIRVWRAGRWKGGQVEVQERSWVLRNEKWHRHEQHLRHIHVVPQPAQQELANALRGADIHQVGNLRRVGWVGERGRKQVGRRTHLECYACS